MRKYAKLLTLGFFSIALAAGPVVTGAYAAPDNSPPPPTDSGKKKKKSSELRPNGDYAAFAAGYRAAHAAIYERGEYASAIEQLKALDRDDNAAVADCTWSINIVDGAA